jgi:ferredoxin, 2Fe-2S
MAEITFVEADGTVRVVNAPAGLTLMEVGKHNNIRGIDADCGGACACATCHVYVGEEWRDRLEPPGFGEMEMLEFVTGPGPGSRLSCQIRVTEKEDGLILRVPTSQN